MTAISNCLTVKASCFGKPIVSNSDIDPCVDIVPVADANSSVTDDVSSHEAGDKNTSESLKIFIETSVKVKQIIYQCDLEFFFKFRNTKN